MRHPAPAGVGAREGEAAGEGRGEDGQQLALDPQRAEPLGAEEPLLRGHGIHVDVEVADVDRDRAGRLRAVHQEQGAPRMGEVRNARGRA